MTSEELTVLKNDVNKLLEIYNADKPINNDGTFDTEKIKTVTCRMIDSSLSSSDAEKLKGWMESHEFWTSPASSKFHCNVKGGLSAHSLMVAYQALVFAVPVMENFAETKRAAAFSFTASDVFIAAIAHDFCKAGFYQTEFRHTKNLSGNWTYEPYYKVKADSRNLGHGNESVLNLIEAIPEYINKRPVLEAISRHMGFSDVSENESYNYSNFLQNPLVILIQLADQTAAQWWDC